MKVKEAKICLDDDTVYPDVLNACPGCGSCSSVYLSIWLQPLPTKAELDREVRAQSVLRCANNLLAQARCMFAPMDEEPLGMGA